MALAPGDNESGDDGFQNLRAMKLVRALRLIKLVRVLNQSRYLKRLQTEFGYSKQKTSLFMYVAIAVFTAHIMACTWGFVADAQSNGNSWYWDDPILGQIAWNDDGTYAEDEWDGSSWPKYAGCMYWAFMTITSVGYGDVYPRTHLERIVATILMLLGSLVWAVILGGVTAVRTTLEQNNNIFAQEIDELNEIMAAKDIPKKLRFELRTYWHEQVSMRKIQLYYEVVNKLSPMLRREVCNFVHEDFVFCLPFLQNMECVVDLTMAFNFAVFGQADHFGELWTVYVVERGLISRFGRFGGEGTTWGEDFVLDDITLCFDSTAFALTFVEVLSLPKDALVDILARNPTDRRVVRRFAIRLAARRGILRHCLDWVVENRQWKKFPALRRLLNRFISTVGDVRKIPDTVRKMIWPMFNTSVKYQTASVVSPTAALSNQADGVYMSLERLRKTFQAELDWQRKSMMEAGE